MKTNVCYQGDCLEVMKGIEDKSVDMILADLPYGTTACKWDTIIPFEPLWEQYKRIIKDNGAIVLTASQPFTSALVMSNVKYYKHNWVWNKVRGSGHLLAKKRPMMASEDILVFGVGTVKYNPQMRERDKPRKSTNKGNTECYAGDGKEFKGKVLNKRYPINIIEFSKSSGKDMLLHPTQKPVALFEYLIKTYTNEGDLVLDNVAGSGTTGLACKNLNRNFILIEQDEKYCQIIKERVGCEIIKEI